MATSWRAAVRGMGRWIGFATAALLVACGGGGGGEPAPPAVEMPVVQAPAPETPAVQPPAAETPVVQPPEAAPRGPGSLAVLAGRPGGFGYLDGKGADARLSLGDNSVATDAAGNVYLLDHGARIRRVTTEGVVSTRAVKVVIPRPESPITSYAFAVDKEGNFFVTDGPNNRILKVSAAGVVTTYAGSGVAGSADGPAASAQFWAPIGLALADDGTLYVSDYYNATIRRISPDGVVSTLAGQPQSTGAVDGRAAQARFQFPTWLALASDGRLVVSDNRLVRTVDEGGRVTTVGRLPETDYAGSVAEYAGVIYVRSRATGGVLRTRAAIPTGLRPGPASTTPTAWRRTGPATCT